MTPAPGGRAFGDDLECAPLRSAHKLRKDYFYFAFVAACGPLQTLFSREGNSLSQSLTALTAPSGREPLARPGTLHFSGELSRHAKGPIPEGAVAVGDWGSWLPGVTPSGANAPAPPRGSLLALPQTLPPPLKPSPWGRWLRPTGADGRGSSPSPCPIKLQNTP